MNITHLCDLTYYNPIGLKIAEYTINTEILLKYAIKENNYIVCKNLLNNIKELKSNLIFSYAVEQNNNTIIQLLLDYIYDYTILDERDEFNNSPLNKAAKNGNLELCKFLVYNDVDILGYQENENINKKLNNTPLYDAVFSNNYKLVEFLLKNGADPNIWSSTGYGNLGSLPLHITIENNNYKMATLLILHNANPKEELVLSYLKYNMTTKNYSPLYLAIKEKKIKFIKLFKYYCK
jgi:ankyrin repeat protein